MAKTSSSDTGSRILTNGCQRGLPKYPKSTTYRRRRRVGDAPRPAAGNGRPRDARSADDGKNAPHIAALPSTVQMAVDRSGRECGSCSLCCCVLEIVELNRPAHTWCPHFRPSGKGG